MKLKRFIAGLLALLLLPAFASALELPSSASEWLFPEETAAFTVTMQVQQLVPYGESTIDQLNGTLSHIQLSLRTGGSGMTLALYGGGERAALFRQTDQGGKSVLTTDRLPNRTLVSSSDAFSALLSGGEEEDTGTWGFSLPRAVSEADAAWPVLYEALSPYGEDKSTNHKIKNIGTARWVRTARLDKDQAAALHDALCAVLRSGFSASYQETVDQLVFSKAFTVSVYVTEEGGSPMAVSLKGKAKLPDGRTVDVVYLYAFSEKTITYRMELGKGKKGGVGVSGQLTEEAGTETYAYSASWKSSFRSEDGAASWDFSDSAELSGKNGSLQGSVLHTEETAGEEDVTTESELQVDVQSTGGELSGTAVVTEKKNGNLLTQLTLTLSSPLLTEEETAETGELPENGTATTVYDASTDDSGYLVGTPPAGVTAYTAPSSPVTVELDTLSPEALGELQGELFQNTAAGLLLALLRNVPAEELTLLSDNVDLEAFTELAGRFYGK